MHRHQSEGKQEEEEERAGLMHRGVIPGGPSNYKQPTASGSLSVLRWLHENDRSASAGTAAWGTYVAHQTLEDHQLGFEPLDFLIQLLLESLSFLGFLKGGRRDPHGRRKGRKETQTVPAED